MRYLKKEEVKTRYFFLAMHPIPNSRFFSLSVVTRTSSGAELSRKRRACSTLFIQETSKLEFVKNKLLHIKHNAFIFFLFLNLNTFWVLRFLFLYNGILLHSELIQLDHFCFLLVFLLSEGETLRIFLGFIKKNF